MKREIVYRALIYAILLIAVVIMIGPFWWMITTSFKPPGEIFTYPPPILPTEFTLSNYEFMWTAAPLGRFWLNSLLIASIVTPAVVFVTSLAGFAFARFDFKGKRILFYLLLASLTGPLFAILIPTFFVINAAGLYNTYLAIILPYIGWNIALPTLIIRAFFQSIPSSIEDSARIDGCSTFTIYRKIMLPLVMPGLVTIGIFTWMYTWDELAWAITATSSMGMRTMPAGMALFQTQYFSLWGPLSAAAVFGVLPSIILFMILQKYYKPTLAVTGTK